MRKHAKDNKTGEVNINFTMRVEETFLRHLEELGSPEHLSRAEIVRRAVKVYARLQTTLKDTDGELYLKKKDTYERLVILL